MRQSMVVVLAILVAVLCASVNVAFGDEPSSEPGQQVMTARWTDTPADIDGVIGPGEYSAAIPVHVKFNQPTRPPGIIPDGIAPPYNQDDLSYNVYAMYDDENLYIAVDVADDILIADSPFPFAHWDDCVEIFIDGDEVGNDQQEWTPGDEGFQILVDLEGHAIAYDGGPYGGWSIPPFEYYEFASAPRPRGYVMEFRIVLSAIDTQDGDGDIPPGPESSIGFNVCVDDDDDGGGPYDVPEDSYGPWDGSWDDWFYEREDDWGALYFEPKWAPAAKPAATPTTWGQVKSLFQE